MGSPRSLTERFRRYAETEATSTLSAQVALALSRSDSAMRVIEQVPARRRQPALILAALHDLALAGRARVLAAAYGLTGDGGVTADDATRAAVDTVVQQSGAVVELAVRRSVRTVDSARCAVLYPAVAETARRVGAVEVGLVDVDGSAGLNLQLDGVDLLYSNGQRLGDPTSSVQVRPTVVGDRPVPPHRLPQLVARIAVDRDPVDVSDEDDVRWLRACVAPDDPERRAELETELAVAAQHPPILLRGCVTEVLAAAVDRVPDKALPVVTTTWALSRLSVPARRRFREALVELGRSRPVAWVSVEGVGVAPEVPTFGDRPASGHSIIGLTVCDGSRVRVEAVGRCWSRGRLLAWTAGG